MAKEKYDTLMKSCQTNRKNDEHISNDDAHSTENEACCELNMPDFCDLIQHALPGKVQCKAGGLLQYLKQYGGNTIKWNQRGQIIVNDKVIEGSHLIDLLRDAMYPKTVHRPIGYETFYQALRALDAPRSLVANGCYTERAERKLNVKAESQKGDGYIVRKRTNGAPPGFLGPKKKNITDIKWIKY